MADCKCEQDLWDKRSNNYGIVKHMSILKLQYIWFFHDKIERKQVVDECDKVLEDHRKELGFILEVVEGILVVLIIPNVLDLGLMPAGPPYRIELGQVNDEHEAGTCHDVREKDQLFHNQYVVN